MKFIKLTQKTGNPIYIKISQIIMFREKHEHSSSPDLNKARSIIVYGTAEDMFEWVQESTQQIAALINKALDD